jgi:hypothetical protein
MGQHRRDGHRWGGTSRVTSRRAAQHDGRRQMSLQMERRAERKSESSAAIDREWAREAAQLATLLAFIETFVFSKVYHESFDCPTVRFLAVLGIDEEDDRLRTDNDYSYHVAGLVYCFRVFALEAILPPTYSSILSETRSFFGRILKFSTCGTLKCVASLTKNLKRGAFFGREMGRE